MTNWRQLEKTSQQYLNSILFFALVAITGFLVGNQYRIPQSPTQEPIVSNQQPAPADNSVINELQNALTNPTSTASAVSSETTTISGLVSINNGTAAELDTLPGIGPSYAQAIINYRNQFGQFVRLEDIQQVKGIGPKTFEKLKDKITL